MTDSNVAAAAVAWPANHRAALSIVINVNSPFQGRGNPPDAGLDYTATGLQRLLATLGDLDLPATMACTPQAFEAVPQLVRGAIEQGIELAVSQIGAGEVAIDATSFAQFPSEPVFGVIEALPGIHGWPEHDTESSNWAWKITGAGGDFPVRGGAADSPVIIPVSPYWMDSTWLDPARPLPPSSFLEQWSLSLAEIRTVGGLMTVVLHPEIAGRPGIASQMVRFLDEAIESGDVWIASAGQVAHWWSQAVS